MQCLYIDDLRGSLHNILNEDENVFIIGEDIAEPYGGAFGVTRDLSNYFPNRIINTPMSEQGFTGMSIGMALNGLKPIVEIMFGDFITLCSDQIINHLVKLHQIYNKRMHIIIRTPSGGYRGYGATHSQSLEKLFLGIPGLTIVTPSILNHPGNLLYYALHDGVPVLFIENKLDYARELVFEGKYRDIIKIVKQDSSAYTLVKTTIDGEYPIITVITYGGMVKILLEIQEIVFLEDEIPIEIVSFSSISDINYRNLMQFIDSSNIIAVEESHNAFGWGPSVLFELLKQKKFEKFDSIGAKNYFIPSSKSLENFILPSKDEIIKKIIAMV